MNTSKLHFAVAPVITTRPQDVTVDTGSPPTLVNFSCRAEGTPRPTFVWRKGNSSISFHLSQYQLLNNGHQLVIQPPFNDEVSGRYTCIAFNSVGSAEASASLHITNQGMYVRTCDRPAVVHISMCAFMLVYLKAVEKPNFSIHTQRAFLNCCQYLKFLQTEVPVKPRALAS